MRLICSVFILVIFGQYGFSQFFNNGATVTIQPGATLKVETSFTNDNSGTFTNNGVLEVTGNFTNLATFTSGASSEVKFSGNANSTVTPGTAQFQNVTMAKTAANVVLAGNATVNGVLNFSTANNKIVLGMHNLTMGSMGSVTGAGSDKYVVATGAGRMIKPIAANSTLVFEVGDNDVSTNYSPISANITGSSYSGASVGVNLVNATHPDKPAYANDYLTRHWDVDLTGTISGLNNILTGTYVVSNDVVGTQGEINGAVWNGTTWSFANANNSGNTITASTTVGDVDFSGFKGRVVFDLTAYIEGYMTGGVMRPVLVNSTVPGSTSSQCDTITVQLRNSTFPYAVAHTFKGVIGVNGQLQCYFPTSAMGVNYYIAFQHRNALETWSANAIPLVNNGSYNFSTSASQAYGSNMKGMGGGGTAPFAVYSGDIDNDGEVLPADYTLWLISNTNGDIGYYPTDLDGDGEVLPADYTIWLVNNNLGVLIQTP
ncbi:MAG: hypothetical protein IPG18_11490 [Saprospiraceae bacterium]|nr:hypothetical protein [Saprospiraceae bacterium]